MAEQKNLKVPAELHEKLKLASLQHKMTIVEFTSKCCSYFIDLNLDPRQGVALKEVRDVLIGFIRTQEKSFLLPAKEHDAKTKLQLDEISHEIKAVKVALRETKDMISATRKP